MSIKKIDDKTCVREGLPSKALELLNLGKLKILAKPYVEVLSEEFGAESVKAYPYENRDDKGDLIDNRVKFLVTKEGKTLYWDYPEEQFNENLELEEVSDHRFIKAEAKMMVSIFNDIFDGTLKI